MWLMSGVPPSLIVLCQEQLLVQQVHPLLPLDVQGGPHPEGRLVGRLRALMSTDFNKAFMSRQNLSELMYNSSAFKRQHEDVQHRLLLLHVKPQRVVILHHRHDQMPKMCEYYYSTVRQRDNGSLPSR